MDSRPLVTVVGATGAQGGAVVRALIATGKYKIRGLTRDSTSEKAQAIKRLSDDIEMIICDITKSNDVKRAFKDSWAIFAVTDFWAQPDKPEVEVHEGHVMADAAASLQIPYYIFSTEEDAEKISDGKLVVPHCTQKAMIRDYIKEKYPNLKTIYVEPGFYMQNWTKFTKVSKLDDGTVVFALPMHQEGKLPMVDIDDMGPIVCKILENPENFVSETFCVCGDEIKFEDISKTFTKVTGIPAISKTLTREEFFEAVNWLPKSAQDDLFSMYELFEEYGLYGKDNDWRNGQKLTKLNTFEQWLKKTGWKGD